MLQYLRNMEDKLIDMFSTPSIIQKNKQCQPQGYAHNNSKKKFENEDPCHVKAIVDSFKCKCLEKKKTEEPFILPQETIGERAKLETQKLGAGIKIVTPNKLLTRLPVLLAQIKAKK